MIGSAILANKDHVHRNAFISGTPTSLTHATELPDMAGEADLIEIQRYSGGSFSTGTPRTVEQIESYRLNPHSVYNALSHVTQDSPLSGYYAISKGRIYYTGFAAQGYFPLISRSTITGLIPDEYEGLWFMLAMGDTPKEGDNMMPIAEYYMNIGMQGLSAVTSMGIINPVPQVSQAMEAVVARGNA